MNEIYRRHDDTYWIGQQEETAATPFEVKGPFPTEQDARAFLDAEPYAVDAPETWWSQERGDAAAMAAWQWERVP